MQINKLVTDFIDLMNKKQIEAAASMLYIVKDGEPVPFTDAQRESFITTYTLIPVKSCKLLDYKLINEYNNQAKVQVEIDLPSPNNKPMLSKIYLNPIMVDDVWYLTTLDPEAEGVDRSKYHE